MLVECIIKQPYNHDYIKDYKKSYLKVLEKVKIKGIPFRGKTVADTEWRIAQRC